MSSPGDGVCPRPAASPAFLRLLSIFNHRSFLLHQLRKTISVFLSFLCVEHGQPRSESALHGGGYVVGGPGLGVLGSDLLGVTTGAAPECLAGPWGGAPAEGVDLGALCTADPLLCRSPCSTVCLHAR